MVEASSSSNVHTDISVLPLRDVVVYPHMVIPLFVGRKKSIRALEVAMMGDKQVLLVAQKNPAEDNPGKDDLFAVGTLSTVLQMLKLPDGTIKVLVEGTKRAKVRRVKAVAGYLTAEVAVLEEKEETNEEKETEILVRTLMSQFEQYVKMNKKIPGEILNSLQGIERAGRLSDTISAHMTLKLEDKQDLLQTTDINQRLERLLTIIENELDILQVEKRVRGRVKKQVEKSQREYYLGEQLKAIQKELGEMDEGVSEVEAYEKKIAQAGMSKEAKEKALVELKRLKNMSPMSAEAIVVRNYLDWVVGLPWKARSKLRHDIQSAEKILNSQHYGLDKVKERILEYLAVQQRVKELKGPILCLVGPPGVGKTSLGQSIAEATGRKFVRMALGGVRDEAEIRGHRRTYIGSLPGKIIQNLKKVKKRNPVFLFDEVDKMASDFRGDPAAALLEVLDPEQNHAFNDHFLELDYDLSEVMFVATANSLDIPDALLDRMEVIRIPGYTEDEKLNIAMKYIIPKQMERHGLKDTELKITESAIVEMIRYYTREAGVRNLEREIARVCRKVVKEVLEEESAKKPKSKKASSKTKPTKKPKKASLITLTAKQMEKYLGVRQCLYGLAEEHNQVGRVNGLAWTEVGGELLTIEAAATAGHGKSTFTGHLGDVMQESISAAMTVVRSRAQYLGLEKDFYEKYDIHVHVPEGATPKDGPSAGIGMCTCLISILTGIPVRADVAMTGEITLRGEVLPIGGLKEKLLAAHRGGIKTVVIPEENRKDLKEIPSNIKKDLEIKPVRWIDEVLTLALEKMPKPRRGFKIPDSPEDMARLVLTAPAQEKKKTRKRKTH